MALAALQKQDKELVIQTNAIPAASDRTKKKTSVYRWHHLVKRCLNFSITQLVHDVNRNRFSVLSSP